jgi:hypothetical protein
MSSAPDLSHEIGRLKPNDARGLGHRHAAHVGASKLGGGSESWQKSTMAARASDGASRVSLQLEF